MPRALNVRHTYRLLDVCSRYNMGYGMLQLQQTWVKFKQHMYIRIPANRDVLPFARFCGFSVRTRFWFSCFSRLFVLPVCYGMDMYITIPPRFKAMLTKVIFNQWPGSCCNGHIFGDFMWVKHLASTKHMPSKLLNFTLQFLKKTLLT